MALESCPTGDFKVTVLRPAPPVPRAHHQCSRQTTAVPSHGLARVLGRVDARVRRDLHGLAEMPAPQAARPSCDHPADLDLWYHGSLSIWRWDPEQARRIEPLVLDAWSREQALIHAGRAQDSRLRNKAECR